jgi:ABC-type antimicrobial peptide transport system permease subunit
LLVDAMLATWRVSLRRTRADWPIVLAAWLVTLLAAVLLAAGPIYATAASEAGLRRSLLDAPAADRNVHVSVYVAPSNAEAADDALGSEMRRIVEASGGDLVHEWRGSQTLALPNLVGAASGDQAVVGSIDDLSGHATLVDGAWPGERAAATGPIEVAILENVADALALRVGDQLSLVAHPSNNPLEVPVRVVGIVTIDPDGAYWYADDQLITGLHDNGHYQTFGPFLTTSTNLIRYSGLSSVQMHWSTFVDYAGLTADDAATLRNRVRGLSDRLSVQAGAPVQVATGLVALLDNAERSLLVSRTGVLLLTAQLGLLAAYAIVLTAGLLVEHRRIDTALLRSRGATTRDVAALALLEGLLVAGPAVLAAPWLAVAALGLLNMGGPLADAGLEIAPRVSADAYLAAGVAGIGAVALLALPAALAACAFAAEQSGLSRHQTRTVSQRLGIDVALIAVTGIALWQLRLYGAPLTRTVEGQLGIDPLLVAAPAIGILAGGVMALRVLPLLAEALEAAISRGSGLVAALGSRQLARRPLRYTRSALLLMLALSMGVFGLSYASTWSGSQRDQGAYQSGADVRVVSASSGSLLPTWALADAYARVPGVEQVSPVERLSKGISFAATESVDVLGIDAETAAEVVTFRSDESSEPLGSLFGALREGRPVVAMVSLPDDAAYLRVVTQLAVSSIGGLVDGPVIDESPPPVSPADIRVQASALVVDRHGLLFRVESALLTMEAAADGLVLALAPTDDRGAAAVAALGTRLDGPIRLAELGIEIWLPDFAFVQGSVGVDAVWAASDPGGPWASVPLDVADPWQARMAQGRRVLVDVPAVQTRGTTVLLGGGGPTGFLGGEGPGRPAGRLSFLSGSIARWDEPVPVLANRAFAAGIGAAPGEVIAGTVEGARRQFRLAGIVESFPTTDPARPLLILDEPTLGLLRLQGSSQAKAVSEWWLATFEGQEAAVAAAVRAPPLASGEVVSVGARVRALSNDVVALGIIGALAVGSLATGLFAVVGLVVSTAVSARQRRIEFALLRALGLSDRQLSGSLWLENSSLVLVSLVAGTGLGLLIGWLVLPFVTVTQRGTAPVPPVAIQVPWDQILLLNAVSGLVLAIAVVMIGRVLRRLGMGSILRMGED